MRVKIFIIRFCLLVLDACHCFARGELVRKCHYAANHAHNTIGTRFNSRIDINIIHDGNIFGEQYFALKFKRRIGNDDALDFIPFPMPT